MSKINSWYSTHKEITKERALKWAREHLQRIKEIARKSRLNRSPEERSRRALYQREWRKKLKEQEDRLNSKFELA